MSDASRGPGWWQASDGQWYPPEQHPDYRPADTAATTSSGTASDEPASPPGPGSWLASDGEWYPPEQHPDYRPPVGVETAPPSSSPDRVGDAQGLGWGSDDGRGYAQGLPSHASTDKVPPYRRARFWVVALVVLVAVGGGAAIYMATDASGIGLGRGTATITWSTANASSANPNAASNPPPQPFTGTIEGVAVSGTSTFIVPTNGLTPGASSLPLQRYTGSFDGKNFDLKATASLPPGGISSAQASSNAMIVVDGTWGSDNVHAVVTPSPSDPNGNTADFHGTIGQWTVIGTITGPSGKGGTATATATFDVSR